MDGLVSRHFPGLTVDGYAERFAALSHNVRKPLGWTLGLPWVVLSTTWGSRLGDLVTGRLEDMRRVLGRARFSELVRLLALGVGDELWEVHRELLRGMGTGSRLGGLELRTALAEYVIWADRQWWSLWRCGAGYSCLVCAFSHWTVWTVLGLLTPPVVVPDLMGLVE